MKVAQLVVLLLAVAGQEVGAHVPASTSAGDLSWHVVSEDASVALEQTATAPGACRVSCKRSRQKQELWSAQTCLAAKSELVFVDAACERIITLQPLPQTEGDWRATPVVRVFKRAEQERVMSANQFVRDAQKLRTLTRYFRWVEGAAGTPGVPPRYRDDGLGVDLVAIDGMRHTIPFERGKVAVEVLQPGEGARYPLRYQWPKGLKQKLSVETLLSLVTEVPGKSREEKEFPVVRYSLGVEHQGEDKKGNLAFKYKVLDAELVQKEGAPPVDAKVKRALKALRKKKGSASLSPRGALKDNRVNSAEDESQFLEKSLENLQRKLDDAAPPFPEEPVGAGAQWRVTVLELEGFELLRVVYTLAEFDGERGVLLTELQLERRGENLRLPNLPPGVAVWLDSLKLKGTGRIVFDLKAGIPESTANASGEAVLAIQGRSRSQDIHLSPRVELRVKPLEPTSAVAAPVP